MVRAIACRELIFYLTRQKGAGELRVLTGDLTGDVPSVRWIFLEMSLPRETPSACRSRNLLRHAFPSNDGSLPRSVKQLCWIFHSRSERPRSKCIAICIVYKRAAGISAAYFRLIRNLYRISRYCRITFSQGGWVCVGKSHAIDREKDARKLGRCCSISGCFMNSYSIALFIILVQLD